MRAARYGALVNVVVLDLNAGRPNAGVAAICAAIEAAGHSADVVDVRGGAPMPASPEAVIATGGPGSPHEEGDWQVAYRACLRRAVLDEVPLLAICYSFQVLASEVGARVDRLSDNRMGVFPLEASPSGRADPWLSPAGRTMVFEMRGFGVWGGDLEVLARSSEGDVTAARFGEHAVGCVFHPEAEPESVAAWIAVEDNREMLRRNDAAADPEEVQLTAPLLVEANETLLGGFLAAL